MAIHFLQRFRTRCKQVLVSRYEAVRQTVPLPKDPPAMNDYYQRHYRAYFEATADIDPEPFLGRFAGRLSIGDRVLDVGCGSGRDLLWLRHKGMSVTGFERSSGLAGLARRLSGCYVIEGDFTAFDFATLAVDAIVLCGSLVHVAQSRLATVLERILRALEPASERRLVYLSMKEGQGMADDRFGRRFYFWHDTTLRAVLGDCGLRVLDFRRSFAADGRGEVWLGYELHCPRPSG
jgi:SAM-dependent methyltransferase